MSTGHSKDAAPIVNTDVSLTMMKLAIDRGYSIIPDARGDHWFPFAFIVVELLGQSEKYVDSELSQWRKAKSKPPEKHPGAKGKYFRLFEFLEGYHEFKSQAKGQDGRQRKGKSL